MAFFHRESFQHLSLKKVQETLGIEKTGIKLAQIEKIQDILKLHMINSFPDPHSQKCNVQKPSFSHELCKNYNQQIPE